MMRWRSTWLKTGLWGLLVCLVGVWGCGRDRVNPIDPNFAGNEILSPPGNIRAEGDIGRITLNWNAIASTNLKGYGVWRSANSTEGYVRLRGEAADTAVTTARTSFIDTTLNLDAAKVYFYRVNTVDVFGRSSELSVFVSAEGQEDTRPPAACDFRSG